jgi:hypothetical protein
LKNRYLFFGEIQYHILFWQDKDHFFDDNWYYNY